MTRNPFDLAAYCTAVINQEKLWQHKLDVMDLMLTYRKGYNLRREEQQKYFEENPEIKSLASDKELEERCHEEGLEHLWRLIRTKKRRDTQE